MNRDDYPGLGYFDVQSFCTDSISVIYEEFHADSYQFKLALIVYATSHSKMMTVEVGIYATNDGLEINYDLLPEHGAKLTPQDISELTNHLKGSIDDFLGGHVPGVKAYPPERSPGEVSQTVQDSREGEVPSLREGSNPPLNEGNRSARWIPKWLRSKPKS